MGLFDIVKNIGQSQGIIPTTMESFEKFDIPVVEQSPAWKLIDDAYKGYLNVPHDGDYRSFLSTYGILPWIYISSWVISTSISAMPLRIFRGRGKKMQVIEEGDVFDLINRPNIFDSMSSLIELTILNMELCGINYWEKRGVLKGLPVALYSLPPDMIYIRPDPKTKIKEYVFDMKANGFGIGEIRYTPDEIAYFHYSNPSNQFYGQSTLKALQTTLITELNREAYNKAFFENEARPDIILKHSSDLSKGIRPLNDEDRNKLASRWKESFSGSRKARRPVILADGMDISLLTEGRQDMEFREYEKSNRERVLGAMGVPPALVGLYEYANYANTREQIRIFYCVTLPPKMRVIADTINQQILQLYDKELWCEFNDDYIQVLEEDPKDREIRLSSQFDRGIISRNEYREEVGKEALDKSEGGNEYFMQSSYILVKDAIAPLPTEQSTNDTVRLI